MRKHFVALIILLWIVPLTGFSREFPHKQKITFFIGTVGSPFAGRERRAPNLCADPKDLIYHRENIIVVDGWANCVYEVDRKHKIVWQVGEWGVAKLDDTHLNAPQGIDYNSKINRALVADYGNNRVVEIDLDTAKIVNTLSGVRSGNFRLPTAAAYTKMDGSRFVVADAGNNWVVETNWEGKEYWFFGVRGKTGNDDLHLNTPAGIAYAFSTGDYIVSDIANNQVLVITPHKKTLTRYLFPAPMFIHLYADNLMGLCTGFYYGPTVTYILGDVDNKKFGGIVRNFLPMNSNTVAFNPVDPMKVALTMHLCIYEFDLKDTSSRAYPQVLHVIKEKSLKKGEISCSIPIISYLYQDCVVNIEATGKCLVSVEKALPESFGLSWDGKWRQDRKNTFIVLAQEFTTREIREPGNFRIKVKALDDCKVDVWVQLGGPK